MKAGLEVVRGDGGSPVVSEDDLLWFKNEIKQINDDASACVWGRRYDAEATRFCQWEGMSSDGRKHRAALGGREPFPFEGASDSRVRLADQIINECGMVEVQAAMRATLNWQGMEATDAPRAAKMRTLLRHAVRNQMGRRYRRELELVAQYVNGDSPAVALLGVFWTQETGVKTSSVDVNDLVSYFMQRDDVRLNEEDVLALVEAVRNPDREEEALALVRTVLPFVRTSRARRIVRELRESGVAEFPEPYVRAGAPMVTAYRLFHDVFLPGNTVDLENARVIFVRQLLTRSQVEERELTMGWAGGFVRGLVGDGDEDGLVGKSAFPMEMQSRMDDGSTTTVQLMRQDDLRGLYEVVTAYWKATNEDGARGVYTMTFHPDLEVTATGRQLLDYHHGRYPFVDFTREALTRRLFDARGVPELVVTDQAAMKRGDDMLSDHAQLWGLPPLTVPANRPEGPLPIRPLALIPQRRPGEYGVLKGPDYPQTAQVQADRHEARAARYFGLFRGELVDERLVTLHMQNRVDRFLGSLGDALMQVSQLQQQWMTEEEIARVVGGAGLEVSKDAREIQEQYDLVMEFDVRFMDSEFVIKLAETLHQYILPIDTEQTIERDKLVGFLFGAIAPQLAEATLRPVEEANRKEADDERRNFAAIAAGIEPEMREEGQNFALRLQTLMEIGERNPAAFQGLREDAKAILQKRVEHLEFMVQQQQNATTGRVGAEKALPEG